jgi:hypothetical protein
MFAEGVTRRDQRVAASTVTRRAASLADAVDVVAGLACGAKVEVDDRATRVPTCREIQSARRRANAGRPSAARVHDAMWRRHEARTARADTTHRPRMVDMCTPRHRISEA